MGKQRAQKKRKEWNENTEREREKEEKQIERATENQNWSSLIMQSEVKKKIAHVYL